MKKILRYKSICFLIAMVFATAGFGAFANNASAATLNTPTGLTATGGSQQIDLKWTASTDGATGYTIYRSGTKINTTTTNSYSDTGLSASTNWTYTVASYNSVGDTSAQSSSASATTAAITTTAVAIPDTTAGTGYTTLDRAPTMETKTDANSQTITTTTEHYYKDGTNEVSTGKTVVTKVSDLSTGKSTTTTKVYNASGKETSSTLSGSGVTTDTENDALYNSQKDACSLFSAKGFSACIAVVVYWYYYKPFAVLLQVAGHIFDTSLAISIDKKFVDQPFVTSTWKIIRDFSNMIFIFLLLYTGIQTMLGMGDWGKTVRNVVIIALLINFSLFFTKVVIDAGNIFSVGIFQAMGVETTNKLVKSGTGSVPERDLSAAIVANFRPGQFYNAAMTTNTTNAALIFVLAGIVNAFAAYILFKVALIFVARLMIFWFLMIISPFALISFALPKGMGNIWDWWLDTLIKQTFMAPVFLFLLYLIMTVIKSGLLNGFNMSTADTTTFFFASVIGPILVAIMLILALQQILKITEGMAGDLGKMASKYVGQAVGVAGSAALGVATGGASLAMRGTAGLAASAIGKSETLAGLATSDRAGVLGKAERWAGRAGQNIMDRGAKASFDPRQIGAGGGVIGGFAGKYLNKGLSQFGIDAQKGVGAMGVKSGKGGYTAESERRKEAKEEREAEGAERLEVTEGEKPKVIAEKTKEEREDIAIATQREAKEEDFVRTARAEKKDAEEKAQNSGAEQRVSGATTNVATQKAATDKARENLEKMKQSMVATDAMKNDAEQELRKAEQVLQGAEQELEAAQNAPERLAERAEVQKAADKLARAEKQLEQAEAATKKATEILAEAEKTAVDRENERRREQYARDTDKGTKINRVARIAATTAGAALGSVAGPVGAVAVGAAAYAAGASIPRTVANEARVARIRAGRSQKQKDEAEERATGKGKKAAEKEKTLRDLKKKREDAIKDGASEDSDVVKQIDKWIKKAEEGE